MNWQSLYTTQRTGGAERDSSNPDPVRNSFIRDYDRIIFSSAFRRLQNKTQVFPLPGAIFVHNRLTHSLEVASVGRSLGKAVGEKIAAALRKAGNLLPSVNDSTITPRFACETSLNRPLLPEIAIICFRFILFFLFSYLNRVANIRKRSGILDGGIRLPHLSFFLLLLFNLVLWIGKSVAKKC